MQHLSFIRHGRELGFSLDQIRGLLNLVEDDRSPCDAVQAITLKHLEDVKRKISDLQRLAGVLADMAAECEEGNLPVCPIVDRLQRVL